MSSADYKWSSQEQSEVKPFVAYRDGGASELLSLAESFSSKSGLPARFPPPGWVSLTVPDSNGPGSSWFPAHDGDHWHLASIRLHRRPSSHYTSTVPPWRLICEWEPLPQAAHQ